MLTELKMANKKLLHMHFKSYKGIQQREEWSKSKGGGVEERGQGWVSKF